MECAMIRDTRAFVAINAVGALSSLLLVVLWITAPSPHSLFSTWLPMGTALVSFGCFVYMTCLKLSGRPIPTARWARGKSDRQLWTIKGVIIGALLVVSLVIIFYPK